MWQRICQCAAASLAPHARAHAQAHAHGRAKTVFSCVQTRRDTSVFGHVCKGSAGKEEEEDGLNVRGGPEQDRQNVRCRPAFFLTNRTHSLNLALSFRHDFKVKLLAEIRVARQGGVVGQQKAC